jgi:hypothetical protein
MAHQLDAAIADVAVKRHGLVSRDDLVRLGATEKQIRHRKGVGRLEELSPLVFRVPGAPRTPQQTLLAAVIDAGRGAVATRRAGAALWGIPGYDFGTPEVLVWQCGDHLCRLGRLSETSLLPPHHVTERDGIPVVTLPRLCFELAATEHPKRTARTVDNAMNLGMKLESLAEVVGTLGKRGRPGTATMRKIVIARADDDYVPPASELEARYRDLCRAAGLPEGIRQLNAGGKKWIGRVDVAYPEIKLIVELDSRRHWQTLLEAQADRLRTAELVAAGWRVLPLTWDMVVNHPEDTVRILTEALRGLI